MCRGSIYLVVLNAIASQRPTVVDAGVQVAIYDALWFMLPIAAVVLVVLRPGAALVYLEAATVWVLPPRARAPRGQARWRSASTSS